MAKEVFQLDLRWKVGNGQNIKICGDKWLPSPSSFSVQSSQKLLPENATVDELMDKRGWNIERIKEIFWTEEAKIIMETPLGFSRRQDIFMWSFTENGKSSVKSAYFAALGEKRKSRGSASNSCLSPWADFWDLSVPETVKNFL